MTTSQHDRHRQWGATEPRAFSRRALLRATLGAAGATALAACGGSAGTPASGGTMTTTATTTTSGAVRPTAVATGISGGAGAGTATARATAAVASPATRTTSPPPSPRAASPVATDGKLPSPAPGVPDAYLQPPPLFKSVAAVPGRGSTVTTFQISYEPPIAPRDQNRYWQEFEQRLGVKLEPTLTPAGSYAEKLAALTASGDLADLTCVILANEPGQYRVLQQGGYADLTPALTGDALREYPNLALFPEKVWKNVALNGKVYGIPRANFAAGGPLLWRQDWAAKFGAPKPKNADEFFALMTAFTQGDPDGNGQADSYGISSFGNNTFAIGFFQQVFRVPNNWRLGPDGRLTAAIETEEFKGAIAFMRRIFEGGFYHPNTATMTNNQAKDNFQAGRFGGYTDGITALPGASGMRARVKQVTPTAEAVGLVPFGHDGGPGVTHAGAGFFGFVSLAARAGRDRERLRELLRVVNYWGAPFGSEEDRFVGSGVEGVHYTVKPDGTTARTEQANKDLGSFPNLVVAPPVFYYPDAPGDAVYMQGLVRELVALILEDPTLGLYAPTAVSKAGELSRLQADRIGAVVQGREPLGAWDQFVRDWRGRGGDQIRTEYEEALKSR